MQMAQNNQDNIEDKEKYVRTWLIQYRNIGREKQGHFMMTKINSIGQQDRTILKVYATNNRTSKCMKQKLIELK